AFVGRWLCQHAPAGMTVALQEGQGEAFSYLHNPVGWRRPRLRPDFIFRREGRTVAVGDAKYRDHGRLAPDSGELYQLTAYGLAHELPPPREVLLFYPQVGEAKGEPRLRFAPGEVHIRLVGVPVDRLLAGGQPWWPL
ncbi:MAG: hypothetical protein R3310_06850, partial [Candidatus Competibacteraceae bacterium]|nr:hypothetical protein [Candidatus Competibacteraceae bacterium]